MRNTSWSKNACFLLPTKYLGKNWFVNLAKILGVLIFVIFAVLILHYFSYFFFLGNYYIYRLENGTITNGPLCTPNPNPPTNEKLAKIFHQTWKSEEVPPMYKERVEECKKLNSPNYTYMLWTDESTRNFVKERFPDYLELYDSYPLNIQRADVSRYFILYYYGGIYMDLDIGCVKPHDLLYSYDLILPKTGIGISNDLLLSRKEHPFFKQVIDELLNWKLSWGFSISPYAAVMYSTGPGFLTVQLTAYVQNEEYKKDACVLSPELYGSDETVLNGIYKHGGFPKGSKNTWHQDASTIDSFKLIDTFLYMPFPQSAIILGIIAISVIVCIYVLIRRFRGEKEKKNIV